MDSFRAKLLDPKTELFLGCIIESIEPHISKSSGRGYYVVRFSNFPLIFSDFPHRDIEDRYRVGDSMNLLVKWRWHEPGVIYPRVHNVGVNK